MNAGTDEHSDRPDFHIVPAERIRRGDVTDVYFLRGKAALESEGANPVVSAEVRTTSLPDGIPGGIVATRPNWPRDAIKSMLGLRAASSGVFPPSAYIMSATWLMKPCS